MGVRVTMLSVFLLSSVMKAVNINSFVMESRYLHYDTSGMVRGLFGNGSGMLRVIAFDIKILILILDTIIMLLFLQNYLLLVI